MMRLTNYCALERLFSCSGLGLWWMPSGAVIEWEEAWQLSVTVAVWAGAWVEVPEEWLQRR